MVDKNPKTNTITPVMLDQDDLLEDTSEHSSNSQSSKNRKHEPVRDNESSGSEFSSATAMALQAELENSARKKQSRQQRVIDLTRKKVKQSPTHIQLDKSLP